MNAIKRHMRANLGTITNLHLQDPDIGFIKTVFENCVNLKRLYITYNPEQSSVYIFDCFADVEFNATRLEHFGTCSTISPDTLNPDQPLCLWMTDPLCESYLKLFKRALPKLLDSVYYTGPITCRPLHWGEYVKNVVFDKQLVDSDDIRRMTAYTDARFSEYDTINGMASYVFMGRLYHELRAKSTHDYIVVLNSNAANCPDDGWEPEYINTVYRVCLTQEEAEWFKEQQEEIDVEEHELGTDEPGTDVDVYKVEKGVYNIGNTYPE